MLHMQRRTWIVPHARNTELQDGEYNMIEGFLC